MTTYIKKIDRTKVRIPTSQKGEEVRRKKKTKVLAEEVETPKRKKKKKKSTDLVVIDGKTTPAPKIDKKGLRSYFGKHTPVILEMIEMNDNDGALTLLKKKLLQTTVSLVPFAENIIRDTKSQRGIYQYTALVSQVRELITDIRADEDRKYIAQSLLDSVLRPAFMEVAQNIIQDHFAFRKSTEKMVVSKYSQEFNKELQTLATELAKKMMLTYKDVEVKTQTHLKN